MLGYLFEAPEKPAHSTAPSLTLSKALVEQTSTWSRWRQAWKGRGSGGEGGGHVASSSLALVAAGATALASTVTVWWYRRNRADQRQTRWLVCKTMAAGATTAVLATAPLLWQLVRAGRADPQDTGNSDWRVWWWAAGCYTGVASLVLPSAKEGWALGAKFLCLATTALIPGMIVSRCRVSPLLWMDMVYAATTVPVVAGVAMAFPDPATFAMIVPPCLGLSVFGTLRLLSRWDLWAILLVGKAYLSAAIISVATAAVLYLVSPADTGEAEADDGGDMAVDVWALGGAWGMVTFGASFFTSFILI